VEAAGAEVLKRLRENFPDRIEAFSLVPPTERKVEEPDELMRWLRPRDVLVLNVLDSLAEESRISDRGGRISDQHFLNVWQRKSGSLNLWDERS